MWCVWCVVRGVWYGDAECGMWGMGCWVPGVGRVGVDVRGWMGGGGWLEVAGWWWGRVRFRRSFQDRVSLRAPQSPA